MRFSVVIASKDRPGELSSCLEHFRTMDYPAGSWELILVNDGGEKTFAEISSEQRGGLPLLMVDTPKSGGPGYARNIGARLARGEYLAFTDDDCRVDIDWLSGFDRLFRAERWDAAGGLSLNPHPGNIASQAWATHISFLYEYWVDDRQNVIMLVSNNMAVKRTVFLDLGGFDEAFAFASEDRDFSYRLIAGGGSQTFCLDARVWHYQQKPTSLSYLSKQFRYGCAERLFYRKHHFSTSPLRVAIKTKGSRYFMVALLSWLFRKKANIPLITLVVLGQMSHRVGRLSRDFRAIMTGRES
jgi:GT2 family glycosyltransferase